MIWTIREMNWEKRKDTQVEEEQTQKIGMACMGTICFSRIIKIKTILTSPVVFVSAR